MYITGERLNQLCPISIYDRRYLNKYSNIKKYVKKVIYINEYTDQNIVNNISSENYIFFTKMDWIKYFINKILPLIDKPFILVTHNSDYSSGKQGQIIKHPKLIKWFGQNMEKISDKTEGLPIGLENQMWKRTNFNIIEQNKSVPKTNLLYLNFSLKTNKSRVGVMNKLLGKGFRRNGSLPWNEYMRELASYKFAISPKGNGVDCHRTWEALYLGVIPIVEKSDHMSYFKDLPILFVDDYDEIDEKFLNEMYEVFRNRSFNLEKLDINYYKERFLQLLEENE